MRDRQGEYLYYNANLILLDKKKRGGGGENHIGRVSDYSVVLKVMDRPMGSPLVKVAHMSIISHRYRPSLVFLPDVFACDQTGKMWL